MKASTLLLLRKHVFFSMLIFGYALSMRAENLFQIKNKTGNAYQVGISQAYVAPGGRVPAGVQTKALDNLKPVGPNRQLTENDFNLKIDPNNTVFVVIKPPSGYTTKAIREVAVFHVQPQHLIYLQIVPTIRGGTLTALFTTGDTAVPQSRADVLEEEFETGYDNIQRLGTDYIITEMTADAIRKNKL